MCYVSGLITVRSTCKNFSDMIDFGLSAHDRISKLCSRMLGSICNVRDMIDVFRP